MSNSLERRGFLKGALAAAALAPLAGSLASCAGGNTTETPAPTAGNTAGGTNSPAAGGDDNPFGVQAGDYVAHIFNGGYGVSYAEFAAKVVGEKHSGVKVSVVKGQQISQELQAKFASGDQLPAVIDNAGAGKIALATIINEVEDLTSVVESKNYEGTVIKDTLFPGVLEDGMVDGKLPQIRYVMTVFAVWYSRSLFKENGWEFPKTWDEAIALGAKAKEKGKYLFAWGTEAANYYLEMALTSAIKEGGPEVRMNIDNLAENAWRAPAIQAVFGKLKEIIDAGYFKPGGSGTKFTAAQAQWSQGQEALLYPSGAWIENEMKSQTKEGFEMVGAPAPTVSASPKMPYESLHSAADESYIVPSKGNPAVGKEFMRAMLSKDAAANFAKEIKSPTIVKDTVPADGFGSTALASQMEMLKNAGENVFSWNYENYYGLGKQHLVEWNAFMDGKRSVEELTNNMQKIMDDKRNDASVEKYKVEK